MARGMKTGGRVAGTPNKTSATVRAAISKILDEYFNSPSFISDLIALDAKDRVAAMEKLASYVVPKLQATTIGLIEESKKTIEDKLIELSEGEGEEEEEEEA